jgi:hypothetical protein
MQANFVIPNHTQALFRQKIIMGSFSIIIGMDASLISVT